MVVLNQANYSDVGLCEEARQAVYLRFDESTRTHACPRILPTQPQSQHHFPIQSESPTLNIILALSKRAGRRHIYRPTRSNLPDPNLLALWLTTTRSPTTRPNSACQTAQRRRFQCIFLFASLQRHTRNVLFDQATAVPRRPRVRVQGDYAFGGNG